VQKFWQSLERHAQKRQGKGAGGHSIDEEVRAALGFLPPEGAVVLDVGANKGLWSRALLAGAGQRLARLVAFEPSQHNWAEIEAIADPRLMLIRAAVSDQAGSAVLHMDEAGSGLASLLNRDLDHVGLAFGQREEVKTIRLDSICDELGIGRIDFLKLDIEGHELAALRGAEALLKRNAIRALSFEFGGANIDSRTYFRDFWTLLQREHGFTISRIVPGSNPELVTRYHERLECFATTNFLAIATRDQAFSNTKQPQP
jgi:FkbM family methyltransferase